MLLLLAGCQGIAELPPPGAERGGRVSWYAAGSNRPVLAEVASLSLGEMGSDGLVLHDLRVRIDDDAGTIWVRARSAERASRRPDGEGGLRLHPPISIQGAQGGHALLGGAARGLLEPGRRRLLLEEVELLIRGQRITATALSLAQDAPWEWREQRAAPAVEPWPALLQALPYGR